MEASSSAHHWARKLISMGLDARIIAAHLVAPYRMQGKSGKNDANDAMAICEAASRPQMHFVPVKSVEQQSILCIHRLREGFKAESVACINRIRGLLAEFGLVFPQRLEVLRQALPDTIEDAANELGGMNPRRVRCKITGAPCSPGRSKTTSPLTTKNMCVGFSLEVKMQVPLGAAISTQVSIRCLGSSACSSLWASVYKCKIPFSRNTHPIPTCEMSMATSFFQFGEIRPEFQIPVLNERAVRAAAGMLFFLALISFMNAWLTGNFQPTRVFVVGFLIDFTVRIFINPRFSPILILGQWIVRNQQPEWSGAPQKRFAWVIGFALAATMLYLVVLNNVIGPINLIVCSMCLSLLFFETAFGICIGCKVYNAFNQDKAQLCPGGVCEMPASQSKGSALSQLAIVVLFLATISGIAQWVHSTAPMRATEIDRSLAAQPVVPVDPAEAERCKVPDFAKAIGHEEKWKLHNNCK